MKCKTEQSDQWPPHPVRAAEVLVDAGTATLIRARESVADMLDPERRALAAADRQVAGTEA